MKATSFEEQIQFMGPVDLSAAVTASELWDHTSRSVNSSAIGPIPRQTDRRSKMTAEKLFYISTIVPVFRGHRDVCLQYSL